MKKKFDNWLMNDDGNITVHAWIYGYLPPPIYSLVARSSTWDGKDILFISLKLGLY
jgi:hypothetical protein